MAEVYQLPDPVMGRGAGLNADKTTRQLLEERQHLTAPQLPPDDDLPSAINAMNLENVLRDIQTNRCNVHLGRLPS